MRARHARHILHTAVIVDLVLFVALLVTLRWAPIAFAAVVLAFQTFLFLALLVILVIASPPRHRAQQPAHPGPGTNDGEPATTASPPLVAAKPARS